MSDDEDEDDDDDEDDLLTSIALETTPFDFTSDIQDDTRDTQVEDLSSTKNLPDDIPVLCCKCV